MRKVKVFEWYRKDDKSEFKKVEQGIVKFLEFGCDYVELDMGVGTYSTALVEWDNGEIGNIAVELIQFIDNSESK